METVELELGLPDTDIKSSFTSPINLKRDYMIEHRYFVYHNTGLHAVSINFIDELQNYVEGNERKSLFPIISSCLL
uniref:Uncharacterized protein n=1 Tax=Megaselia scalaris TaxID=36166 RepID=T1GBE7_MEGSC